MTNREKAFQKKLDGILNKVGKLQEAEVKKVLGILEATRKEIASRIAETDWEKHWLPEMKEATRRAMDGFRQRYASELKDADLNMWNAGYDIVDGPLAVAGITAAMPEIPRTTLEVLQGYSADLVTGLSEDALKKINTELTLGITGGKTPFQVMQAIGRNLEEKSVFSSIASRSETITRTEMARVHSMAAKARREQATEAGLPVRLQKKWLASGKPTGRPDHQAADGQVVDEDEPFIVGGEEIPYPHAPGLPAKEVVNCG